MFGTRQAIPEVDVIAQAATKAPDIVTLLCLPATLLARVDVAGIALGGQDCHKDQTGAHTGDVSADMLKDAGASYVILGHSERRQDHGETDALVRAKATAALETGLTAIVCVGETRAQYEAGKTLEVLRDQLVGSLPEAATSTSVIVAYEPIWAIGTGLTPTLSEIQDIHSQLRAILAGFVDDGADMSVLYGGSVKPGNADQIFALPDVDGGLVGGASLKAADFVPILQALQNI